MAGAGATGRAAAGAVSGATGWAVSGAGLAPTGGIRLAEAGADGTGVAILAIAGVELVSGNFTPAGAAGLAGVKGAPAGIADANCELEPGAGIVGTAGLAPTGGIPPDLTADGCCPGVDIVGATGLLST